MTRKKALMILGKRIDHLEKRIDQNLHRHLSFDEAEVAALEIAIKAIKFELEAMSSERSDYDLSTNVYPNIPSSD